MAAFDAFMIPNSPKSKSDKNDAVKPKEVLILAPFNPSPKIEFQNVKVGDLVSQYLCIQNPGSSSLQVELVPKVVLAEKNFEITSTKFEVAAGQGVDLSINWKPNGAGAVKVPILVHTNTRFRSEFTILGVAVGPNKAQKKILGAQNSVSEKRIPVVPVERRKTFVLRSNKENAANSKNPKAAPRKVASAATVAHPSRSENLVVSPFVSSHNRFRDVELSPAVIGPWKQEPMSPVHETIRRETYGVSDKAALPKFVERLEECVEEQADTVDCSVKQCDSFANVFQPDVCSTVKKTFEGNFADGIECSSGVIYDSDRLSTETYIKEELSGSILESIDEDAELPTAAVLTVSPPKALKKRVRASPTVVTRRKISVVPEIVFTPPESEDERKSAKLSPTIPRVAVPRLTLTRAAAPSRHSLAPKSSRINLSKSTVSSRQSLTNAASSSRQTFTNAASASRQSLANAASSRQSFANAASSSRQSFANAAYSSRQSFANAASSSRQSFANATSSSRQSFANPASSSRQSFANAASSRQSFHSSTKSVCPNSQSWRTDSAPKRSRQEKSEFLYDTDAFIAEMINNDLVAASTSADPFLANTLFFDDSWKLKQEKDMIKWLNVLLTPSDELVTDTDSSSVDIADVWQRCCRTDKMELAPTREEVSAGHYDGQGRLAALRKAAISFLAKTEMREVLGKVSVHIDRKLLAVREDKDLHLDTGLKHQVLELLLSYNPLWLRIGLEAIYGRTVILASNSDVVGLTNFMKENLLSDKNIIATHTHPTVAHLRLPTFGDAIKKFILKKFFFLVYFLDQAKRNRLIGHDPCLFMKKSKYKESREILLAFSSMFLSGVGDVLKHLALLGYHVSVKQQYIDEYEFAVTCLKDLRDGVRLVRVMEIILKSDTLMAKLRVPAISMLQKVHNMEVALQALSDAGYVITGNITPKDLVNGHYEKTLSLLWQIIYKFQAPRLEKAASKIQSWWTKLKLFREIRSRIAARKRAAYVKAAIRIQTAWRARLARKRVVRLREERAAEMASKECAAILIQKTWRMHAARKQLMRARQASNRIKEWFAGAMIARELRAKFLTKRRAAVKIQSLVRGYLTRKRLANLRRTAAALRIQTWFRRRRTAKVLEVASTLARAWIDERKLQTQACLIIQERFRAHTEMKKQRSNYVALRSATVTIQRHFRLFLIMKKERTAFLSLRHSAIACQQVFRAQLIMKAQRAEYLAVKMATVTIQRWYRANRLMREAKLKFLREEEHKLKKLRNSNAILIQRKWRATLQMRVERRDYLTLRSAVVTIQARWRALVAMKEKADYEAKNQATVVIQRRWRAIQAGRNARRDYLNLKKAAVFLQRRWRAKQLMERQRSHYLALKAAAVFVQWKYRLKMYERSEVAARNKEQAAIKIQAVWRGYSTRKKQSAAFAEMHERCKNATKAAREEKTLGYISLDAFNLLRSGQCHKAMEALLALNKITILSKELCFSLAENGVANVLYTFLSQLNRSEVHRQFLIHGTAILLNLAKCSETANFVWQDGSRIYFYLHLMNVWIMKEDEIFLNCATVLWHFAHYPKCAKKMICEPRMGRLLEIFLRKASKKRRFSGASPNADVLPSEAPSWGLVLKDGRPSRFSDSLFAVQILISVLYDSQF